MSSKRPAPLQHVATFALDPSASPHANALPGLVVRPAQLSDHTNIMAIEQAGYPADEAATPHRMLMRLQVAREYFFVAELDGKVRVTYYINVSEYSLTISFFF